MSPAKDNSHAAALARRRNSSTCSQREHSPRSSLYKKRTRSAAAVVGENMKVISCSPLQHHPLHERKATPSTSQDGTDVRKVVAADFFNCSSFYANIYPSKISRKAAVLRSINSNVLPLRERRTSFLSCSSSLPDLSSTVNAPTTTTAGARINSNEAAAAATTENFSSTDLMVFEGDERNNGAMDDALVDSCRKSGSSSSSLDGSDNNNNDDNVSTDELVLLGKTNSLHNEDCEPGEACCSGEVTQSTGKGSHDLSSPTRCCHQREELNVKKSLLPEKRHRHLPQSDRSMSYVEKNDANQRTLSACISSCEEISSEDGKKKNGLPPSSEWPPTVKTIEAHEIIDVEKEEEMLRQASMVSKGLYKHEEASPPPPPADVIIEDVSDEEFQRKDVGDEDSAASVVVDLEEDDHQQNKQCKGNKKKTIPKLDLDDPLLKGFEVALDKISTANDTANNTCSDNVPASDDPITKRAIERLDRRLQEAFAANRLISPNPPSWQERMPAPEAESTEEVVQLRKQVKRPPTPKRHSKTSSPVGQKEDAQKTKAKTTLVTVEVNGAGGESSLPPPPASESAEQELASNKGIYKATFITPILRRKKSPPRPSLGPLRTSVISDDEPLDLRSFRSNHSDRVFSVPSSPVWPRISSRFMDTPPAPSFSPQISPLDYHRPFSMSAKGPEPSLRTERYVPIGYNDPERQMTQSPLLADGDIWRWPTSRDLNNYHYSSSSSASAAAYDQAPMDPLQYRLADSLSSMRVTSRRPLHPREQLRVFTDRPPSATTHLSSHFRSNSGDLGSSLMDQSPYTSSFRNYVGPSLFGSDPVDPIAKKALERFDCCTTNSPRTFGSNSTTPSSMLTNTGSSYDTYQDPIVRSAVMRMDNQLAAAYTANRRPDYTNGGLSRRSSMNFIDACDTIPEAVVNNSPLLSLREDGTSGSMATLGPKDGLRSREGSVPNSSLVDQLETRSVHNMRHIFNYLEDHDFKLSHSQTTLKQTPSRQYFSCSREYTRPRVRPEADSNKPQFSQGSDRTAPPPAASYNDRLPPKNVSDRQESMHSSQQANEKQQFLRTASSYSNLYIAKDAPDEGGSNNVDFDSNVINSPPAEGQQGSSASSTPAPVSSPQTGRQTVGIPISRQNSRRGQRSHKSGEDASSADRCRSLERAPSSTRGTRASAVSGSPRVSPARNNRRGLSVSTGQPKTGRTARPNGQVENGSRRKPDQGQKIAQPAGRLKQPQTLLGRRAQTPRLSVVNSPQKPSGESEQDCWDGGRTTPMKWQMSVFERLYYNRKR